MYINPAGTIQFNLSNIVDYISTWNGIKVGAYQNIVVTTNGTLVSVYVDGVLVYAAVMGGVVAADSTSFGIGSANGDSNINAFKGVIEEVAVWNRALSTTEIKDLYRKGVSRLDLNIYSCSDATCSTKTGSQYISDTNNGLWMDLNSSLLNSRYLGMDAIFTKARGFTDYNAGTFWVGSYFKDFNVYYLK